MNAEYEIVVQYKRGGGVYYDVYYSKLNELRKAVKYVKRKWLINNVGLFPEAPLAKFFYEVG